MINLLIGPPGGGKSYEAVVYHLLTALNRGRMVITNLPVNLDEIELVCPGARDLIELRRQEGAVRPFSVADHYGHPWRHPENGGGPLYIIDECHKAIPAGRTDIKVEEWYAEHRHELADVLLITQSYGKISKAIRDSVQVVYRCRKATAFGTNNRYIRKVQDGIRGEVVNENIRTYEARYFKLYNSHTRSGAGAELAASDIKPIWQHWSFRGAALFLAVGVGLMFLVGNPFKSKAPPPVQNTAVTDPVAHVEAIPAAMPAESATPRGSEGKVHPYQGYTLHLAALLRGTRQGVDYLMGYVVVAFNGQPFSRVSFDELREAGYEVAYHSPGVISLTYKGFDIGFVVTDVPKVGLANKVPGNG